MDTQFNIDFKIGPKATRVKNFRNSIEEAFSMDDDEIFQAIEYVDLQLRFSSENNEAKIYLDSLDVLPNSHVSEDEYGNFYLPPSDEFVPLFSYKSEDGKPFSPLSPGYYMIRVSIGANDWYSLYKVNPKQLNETQWNKMIDEIEEIIKGLSYNLVKKNTVSNINTILGKSEFDFQKIISLQEEYRKVLHCLHEILNEPRSKVSKKYELISSGKNTVTDKKSIQLYLKHPESRGKTYSPRFFIDYSILENKWILYSIRFIKKELLKVNSFLEKYLEKLDYEKDYESKFENGDTPEYKIRNKAYEEIYKLKKLISNVLYVSNLVLNAEWATEVNREKPSTFSHVLSLDFRYNKIYRLYIAMSKQSVNITTSKNYDLIWKRTDKLYEIWGFISLVKLMSSEEVGFTPKSGWIYDNMEDSDNINVPFLSPGTKVVFQKEELFAEFIYDGMIPFEATEESTLYARSRKHRPDARIDFFSSEREYIGTVVIDFKYRPQKNIWNDSPLGFLDPKSVKYQLINYRNNLDSKIHYPKISGALRSQFKPVIEVWAIYPRDPNGKDFSRAYDDKIRLVELSPMVETSQVVGYLKDAIDGIIELHKSLKKLNP